MGKYVAYKKKLLLSVEEVAELTGLPVGFWIFVAEKEQDWDIERFFYAAGSHRITPYYLEAYLLEDLGMYYQAYEAYENGGFSERSSSSFGSVGENFSEMDSSVQ